MRPFHSQDPRLKNLPLPIRVAGKLAAVLLLLTIAPEPNVAVGAGDRPEADSRPNILLAIADDWGWPHAGAYGDPVVQTPAFDRIAREGVLLEHAYVSSPSCTPSRGALLTGQYHWRLGPGANLWCVFPDRHVSFVERLAETGYAVGMEGKGWGPGKTETPRRQIAGPRYKSLTAFLDQRPAEQPFCFWLGTADPHRPYQEGVGEGRGIDLERVRLPGCFPDVRVIRSDVADYLWEVERFDRLVQNAIEELDARGLSRNTIVIMTSDHGMPFPRCKAHLYDTGVRVPLAIRWPARIPGKRVISNLVSLVDLAPTLLEAAGCSVPDETSGQSLLDPLTSSTGGQVGGMRDDVVFGKERHTPCQDAEHGMGGYPSRGLRTRDFLYIRNFRPERWPAGTPHPDQATIPGAWYGDTDNGPTKRWMVDHRDQSPRTRMLYELAFSKRPAEELYDLRKDPEQLINVANDEQYAAAAEELAAQLEQRLTASGDPRMLGTGDAFDAYRYLGGVPKHPDRKAP